MTTRSYVLSTMSGALVELWADSDESAIGMVYRRLGASIVHGAWGPDESDDCGRACKRVMFWRNADWPNGKPFAQLSTLGGAQ